MYHKKYLPPRIGGFTMIEILIVVIMIALLAVVGGTAYTATMETSRDGRRKIDMENIRNALELYRSDNSTYPKVEYYPVESPPLKDILDPTVGKKYITMPVDPKSKQDYFYWPLDCETVGAVEVCNSYMLGVTLENAPASVADDCANLEAGPGIPACTDTDGQPAKCTYCVDPYGLVPASASEAEEEAGGGEGL